MKHAINASRLYTYSHCIHLYIMSGTEMHFPTLNLGKYQMHQTLLSIKHPTVIFRGSAETNRGCWVKLCTHRSWNDRYTGRFLILQIMYQKFTDILFTGAKTKFTKLSSQYKPRIVELITILYNTKTLHQLPDSSNRYELVSIDFVQLLCPISQNWCTTYLQLVIQIKILVF